MSLEFNFDNELQELSNKLSNIHKKVEDDSFSNPILEKLGVIFTKNIKRQFNLSEDPYYKEWKPLKNPSEKRGGSTAKPLLDRGRLVNSITHNVIQNKLTVGTNVKYAEYHQNGTSRIPARPFLPDQRGMPEEYERDIELAIEAHLEQLINNMI